MLITSVNNPNVILWNKLKRSKYQKEYQKFIIEELLVIEEAKKANLSMITIALESSGLDADYFVSENVMKKISSNNSLNNIIAVVDFFEHKTKEDKKIVYLDNLQDPGNIGTIIRTAYSFGYSKVVLNEGVNKYNHKLISASKGALFHIEVVIDESIETYKEQGYQIVGTLLDESSQSLEDLEVSDKMVIVFGNEGQGISDAVKRNLDDSVYIEMNNFDSLNVAVTAGIVLYKFR